MNEVVREFLLESDENLAQLDLDLLALEKDPTEKETIARAFRTLHTVKGTAGFLGLERLQAVSHAAENLLSKVRAGELVFGPPIAAALLAVLDAIREMLRKIEVDGDEGERDDAALIDLLESLAKGETPAEPHPPAAPKPDTEQLPTAITGAFPPPSNDLAATVYLPPDAALDLAPPPIPTEAPNPAPPLAPTPPKTRKRARPKTPIQASLAPTETPAKRETPAKSEAPADAPLHLAPGVADTAIRVNVSLLDSLMNVVGELVLTRNQILRHTSNSDDVVLTRTVQRLNLLTTELQAGVMKTRMQPVGAVWSKFPRLVRDLSVACGKQVRFEMEGQETELDKTILEAIRDPLTHMVRNAVDHGIERLDARAAAGKSPEGVLRLHAFHEGGKVVIEVSDDGGGIDPKRIVAKAVRVGLLTDDAAKKLSERETLELVFRPGFSTSETVTQFSGRGVGMDVVRTNVEKMGGAVDLESRLGVGTTVRMKMPLTLAIVPALVVSTAGERFAIPQASLLELIRVDRRRDELERVHDAPVFRLRGRLLPLAFLNDELGLEQRSSADAADGLLIVVLQADDRQFGLVVDAIHDTEEIVVKPLQPQVKALNVYAGATIMGDGRVALILDVMGLAKRTGLSFAQTGRSHAAVAPTAEGNTALRHKTLVFAPRQGGRMAMALDQVARLEEFRSSAIERIGPRRVVQFRGSIMPLVDVGELMSGDPVEDPNAESLHVVVHERAGGNVGLLVGRVVDVIEDEIAVRMPPLRAGAAFNTVVGGAATEFLDVDELLRRAEHLLAVGERTVA